MSLSNVPRSPSNRPAPASQHALTVPEIARTLLRGPRRPRIAALGDHESRGQAIVEFALVVSFLFMILFAIVDFSRLFFAYATMANGVREGARYGVAHPGNDAAIIDHAQAMMVLIGDEATVTVAFPDTDERGNSRCSHYCRIVVTANCDFDVWTPIIPHVEIVAQSTMHVE